MWRRGDLCGGVCASYLTFAKSASGGLNSTPNLTRVERTEISSRPSQSGSVTGRFGLELDGDDEPCRSIAWRGFVGEFGKRGEAGEVAEKCGGLAACGGPIKEDGGLTEEQSVCAGMCLCRRLPR